MPSYRDGRVCCESAEECAKLNKDYPLCSELIAYADYQSGAECAGEEVAKTCSGSSTQACGCKGMGVQTRTCNTTTGQWSAWGACSISDACECTDPQPASSQTCNICGTQTRTVTCNTATGQWDTSAWTQCDKEESECGGTKTCDDWLFEFEYDGADPCSQANKVFPEDLWDATLPENASVEEFIATCCASCPEGEYPSRGMCCPVGSEAVYNDKGEWVCSDCSRLGPNYYYDDGGEYGGECKPKFVPHPARLTMVYGDSNVYIDFQETGTPCQYNYTGTPVSACVGDPEENLCAQCDASAKECNISCYEQEDIADIVADLNRKQYLSGRHVNKGYCSASFQSVNNSNNATGGVLVALANRGDGNRLICSGGGSYIYWRDMVSEECENGCGGKSEVRSIAVSFSSFWGSGFQITQGCFRPELRQFFGYTCRAE